MEKNKAYVYLDDIRTPVNASDWVVVRNYNIFVDKVNEIGLDQIECISLDHDLGESAMQEYYKNVSPNFTLDYTNITEKTGLDCAKFLVELSMDTGIPIPMVFVHSANPIGSANIMGYINNYLMNQRKEQTCVRVNIPHTVN